LLLHRAWEFLAQWHDLETILSLLTKAWVDQVNLVLVQVELLVQLVQVVHQDQAELLVQLVLAELLVQVDLLHVQVVHPVVLQAELQVLVLQEDVQVLVAVVAVAVQLVLSVRVDQEVHLRLESQRE
jgi:hypothetical protein